METVFVGLSGGVDSALSAYTLKKQGYKVVGAFIKGWEPDFLPCTGVRDRLEAMRVSASLGIPFVTYDLEEEYKRDVVDYFVSEYKKGRTPNPDVMCNRVIKFGAFWNRVKADGADYIATGHYARVSEGENDARVDFSERTKRESSAYAVNSLNAKHYSLNTSRDSEKDQTYFLWMLKQDDLKHTLFPVGNLVKSDVRSLALAAGLPNATRPDSQGLCFLGHVDMRAFLKRYLPTTTGVVRNESGKAIGEHEGAWFYTIGQRHGFSAQSEERMYVVGRDVIKNELVVSSKPLGEHPTSTFALENVNWISGNVPQGTIRARYRYRQALLSAEVKGNSISFETPQQIASGQSVVVYDQMGETVLGGGTIH